MTPTDLTGGIVRILKPNGETSGTGFALTEEGLVVTCAHVITDAQTGPGGIVRLVFHHCPDNPLTATVQENGWRSPDAEDIAILRLNDPLPEGVKPLSVGLAQHAIGHSFVSFGYPELPYEESHVNGAIDGLLKQGQVLQISSTKIAPGVSGAPVLDTVTGQVVGVINSFPSWVDKDKREIAGDQYGRNREINYATPTEVLLTIWPDLRPADICPYRGLAAFTESEAKFFFGRETLAADLVQHLRHNPRFLAVIGPSGSGKSSVVWAGLFPALRRGEVSDSAAWHLLTFRPGSDPIAALANTELGLSPDHDLQTACRVFLETHPDSKRLVLFADQFEELFALCTESAQAHFIADLLALLDSNLPVTVMLALRADFYDHLLRSGPLVEWLKEGQVNIPPMRSEELQATITGPAQQVGLHFEAGLAELMVEEAGQIKHPLPLLESALTQLWEKRADGRLTQEVYRRIGRVTGAIGQWAEDTYSGLSPEEKQLARRIFTRLVHFGEGETVDTRQRQALTEIGRLEEQETIHRLAQRLANARLLVTDRNPATGEETIEIVHDALLNEWGRLRRWLTEQREFYLWRQRLDERLHEWQEKKGELLHDAALTEAERWLAERADDLNQDEQIYIQDSAHERTARELLWRRIKTGAVAIALIFIVMLVVGMVITTSLAILAWWQRGVATERGQEAMARQLAAEAINVVDSQYDLALLLSLQANYIDDIPEGRAALLDVLEYNPRLMTFLQHHIVKNKASFPFIAFSPDGQLLASATCLEFKPDAELKSDEVSCITSGLGLWNVPTGQPLGQVFTTSGFIGALTFSPDGQVLAVSTNNKEGNFISFWDVKSRQFTGRKLNHNSLSLAFSPNEQILATGGFDKKIRLWDVTTGQPIGQPLIGHNDYVASIAFSPDSKMLASGGTDGLILLWDIETRQVIGKPLLGHTYPVMSLAFSPDGKMLASTGSAIRIKTLEDKGCLILWDISTHQPAFRQEFGVGTLKVAFSSGSELLAVSDNNVITLWSLTTRQQVRPPLKGHSTVISDMAFSPDGETLASSSTDGTIILWNISERPRLGQPLLGHSQWVHQVAFSPDGQVLASAGKDKTIRLWDVATGQPLGQPLVGNTGVLSLAFSPDGRLLASGGFDPTIILWDVATGQLLRQLRHKHSSGVINLCFSPDGKVLASSGLNQDKNLTLWDVATGQPLGSPLIVDVNFLLRYDTYDPTIPHPAGDPGGYLNNLVFSPDGRTLLASGNGGANVMIWDMTTRQRESRIAQIPPFLASYDSAISPDRTIIASGDMGGTVYLWKAATGQLKGEFHLKDTNPVWGMDFSPDGKILAVSTSKFMSGRDDSKKGEISLWDVVTLKPLGALPPSHTGDVKSLAFSPDGHKLATGGGDGGVILWDVNFQSWQARACQIANRNLSLAEWQQYLGDTPYQRTCPDLPSGEGAPPDAPAASNNIPPTPTPLAPSLSTITQKQSAVISLPPFSATLTMSSTVGAWRAETSKLPDGLQAVFPAYVQCRQSAESDILTQEYLGLWAVKATRNDMWASGKARITLATEGGTNKQQYEGDFNLAANQAGWFMSTQNKEGLAMSTNIPVTTVLKLSVYDIGWKPVRETTVQYRYTVESQSQGVYGNPVYPQHFAVFKVHNLSDLTMHNVRFIGIAQNQQGETVDILSQGFEDNAPVEESSKDKGTLARDEFAFFIIKSHSQTGRCVGPADPKGYTLHYWLTFETDDGQFMSRYEAMAVPGSEK